jgi:hypothetical protein
VNFVVWVAVIPLLCVGTLIAWRAVQRQRRERLRRLHERLRPLNNECALMSEGQRSEFFEPLTIERVNRLARDLKRAAPARGHFDLSGDWITPSPVFFDTPEPVRESHGHVHHDSGGWHDAGASDPTPADSSSGGDS